jgi:hypothetical protein
MSKQATTSSSVGFPALLTLAFIVLKLTHVIAWSWLWVLAPLWISLGLVILIFVIGLLAVGIGAFIKR